MTENQKNKKRKKEPTPTIDPDTGIITDLNMVVISIIKKLDDNLE